jgi:hypothetical protein
VVKHDVETPQDIDHQDPVRYRVPEVVKGINFALHLLAVLTYGKIPLLEGAEVSIKLEGPSLGVAQELSLELQLGLVRGVIVSPDDVM